MNATLNLSGRLTLIEHPIVMAIVNVTPDSFYAPSRLSGNEAIEHAIRSAMEQGADWIDIGGCSTRPVVQMQSDNGVREDAIPTEQEEWQRVRTALAIAQQLHCPLPISVDTFRPYVAERAMSEFGVAIINDISGGTEQMYQLVGAHHAAYVLTFNRTTPHQETNDSTDDSIPITEVMRFLADRIDSLHQAGVADVIIDPGFGFNQTVSQSLSLLEDLPVLTHLACPILVGISRKRMAYAPHGLNPETCLQQTLELEHKALTHGANILRVHDVTPTIQMIHNYQTSTPTNPLTH